MGENVYKTGHRKGFTTVYRAVAQDKRLSLKARGLFLLLQSLPEDWNYTISGLAAVAGSGKDQIRSGLGELLDVGYLVKEQAHDGGGKFSANVFILQEEAPVQPLSENPTTVRPENAPLSENPVTGKPDDGKTVNGKPDANKITINKSINKPPISPQGEDTWELFEAFYKAYPRHQKKPDAKRAWGKLAPDLALYRKMAAALDRFKASRQWCKDQGQYIPLPASWLNGRCWEDDPGPMYKPSPPPPVPPEDEQRGRYL